MKLEPHTAAATTAADLQKTADLLARVSLEQNEAEELMKEKRAADASCAELEQAQEQAKAELAMSAWALLRVAQKGKRKRKQKSTSPAKTVSGPLQRRLASRRAQRAGSVAEPNVLNRVC